MFQFLNGAIKAVILALSMMVASEFQFLNGAIKTDKEENQINFSLEF
jgi:hypothetical protein